MIGSNERRGPAIEPREIKQEGDAGLRITWGDDRACTYTAAESAPRCPCAQCVNEWTGQRTLNRKRFRRNSRLMLLVWSGVTHSISAGATVTRREFTVFVICANWAKRRRPDALDETDLCRLHQLALLWQNNSYERTRFF